MADKINREEGIARVYQFLNKQKDWKTEADLNGNGTICKTEFANYLYKSDFKFNSGENKQDLVDLFWKSIDFNQSGKVSDSSRINNKFALDDKEIKRMEDSVEATKRINDFMKDKEAPKELDEQFRMKWKNSVKQGLIYRASEYLKSGSIEDITEEWLNNTFKLSSAKATADYTATAEIKEQLGNVEGYAVGDDKVLSGIIDEYIKQLEGTNKDDSEVIEDIKEIVAAYVDTANTNSKSSVTLLAQYGYDPKDYLNDLQRAVLTRELANNIIDYIKTNEPDIYVDGYKEQIENMAKSFVEEYLNNRMANEFNSIKSSAISEFVNMDEFKTLVADVKEVQAKVQTARDELNTYIANILAEQDDEKTAIVKDVIGVTAADKVAEELLKLNTVEEIEAKRTELETRINNLNSTRAEKQAEHDKAISQPFDWSAYDKKYTAHISENGDRMTYLTTKSLSDLYNQNGVIDLMNVDDMKSCSLAQAKTTSITNLKNFLNVLVSALQGTYDSTALSKASEKVINLYTAAFNHATTNFAGKKDTKTSRFEFNGEAYEYQTSKYYYNSTTVNTSYSAGCSASNNQLGMRICNEYDDGEFKVLVNARCVMDFLEKFYREALGL